MRAIITGGGTGGHIYPAIAIADEIMRQDPESEILYIGTEIGLEKDIVPKSGYPMKFVSAMWIDRSNPLKILKTGTATLRGIRQSLSIMKKFKPDVVIGTGGYVCFPVLFAGHRYGARCYIHEQNAFPGMANRSLERFVDKVFLGFAEGSEYFKEPQKHVFCGNPVRDAFFSIDRKEARRKLGIPENSFTIFSFGGSQGAEKINETIFELLRSINGDERFTLFFGTGSQYYEEVLAKVEQEGISLSDNIYIESYIDDMPAYLGAADIVISRSGALSVAEICTAGAASILIPSPNVTGNHQYFNAKSVADQGGAILIEEKDLVADELITVIKELADNRDRLIKMRKASSDSAPGNAAKTVVDVISEADVEPALDHEEDADSESAPQEDSYEEIPKKKQENEEACDEAEEEPEVEAEDEPVEETEVEAEAEEVEETTERTMEGIAFREIPREKRIRRKAHHLRNVLIVLIGIVAIAALLASPLFCVKSIHVEGNHYYSDEEVLNMSGAKTGQNIFFHSQKKQIISNLSKDSYFEEVKVSVKGINQLVIHVVEREQVAALVYGNRYVVIDIHGRVLRITEVDPKITIIKGLTLSKIKSGKVVKAEESTTLEDTLTILQTMKSGDLYFKKIEVSRVYLKAYIYDTLLVQGKSEDMKRVIDSGYLQKVVKKLYDNKTKRGTISVGQENYISFSPAF